MLYFQFLIFLICLITKCLSQSCILQVYDVCVRCSDNSHLYEDKCFLNILYCSQYQEGSKCIQCIDGFQLKQNSCSGEFGLGNKNGSKVQDDKNTTENTYAEMMKKLSTRRQIKSVYNNLPKDGWRQLSFQQSLKPFILDFIMLSFDAVKYFQRDIQAQKFYFIWYERYLYYRILFTVSQSKGLYETVIQREQPIQRSSLYYVRYFYPNDTQLFIIQDQNLDIVNRFLKNINRLYPQKRTLTPYYFFQSSDSQGLKFYRTIFFNPNLGLSQFVFNQTDFNRVGPLEQIDSFDNLTQEQTQSLELIKYYSSQWGYNEDSELYAMTKQTFNENFTTYNFTFISKDQQLRYSPNRISAKLALDIENGKITIRKLRVRKIFVEGEKTEIILNYQCNFNYSRIIVPAKENFIVFYNLTGFQNKLFQSFKEIMICVRPDNEYKIQDFVQFAKYDNTTHLFFELRYRNKTGQVSETYFTFYFDKKANLARLIDFYQYQNLQFVSVNFYAEQFINNQNKAFQKYFYNLNKQFDLKYLGLQRGTSVLATKRLAQLYQSDIYQSTQNSILNKPANNIYVVSFMIRYPDEIIYEYEYVELRFQAKIQGSKMPLTLNNSSFKFTRTLKYPRQNYTLVSQMSYPVVFNQYNKRVFSKTNYLFFMMGKVYQSVQRPTFVRFYCQVTDKNSSLKLIFYEMDLSGFQLTLIINMTVVKSTDEMENCNPFSSCQKLPKSLMNYSSIFQDPQIQSYKNLVESQFADVLQDLRFIYMRIFSQKQNDFVYEIGYGNRVTFQGFVIYISIISSKGLYLTKISTKQAKIGPGLYITIGDYYKQLDEPKISAAEKKRYIVKRSFHLASKDYRQQIEMYRKVTSSKLNGYEEESVQYDNQTLKITGIWGQKWIFFSDSPIFFIRKEQMECYPTVVTFDKIKYMKLVNDTIGTDLGQFSLFKVANYRCIYYTDFQYYKVSLTFNRTKQLYNLSKIYQFETMTLEKAFDTELPMKYSSNYQMKILKNDQLQKIQPASSQAKQYLNRIFGSRARALSQRRYKFSAVRLLVYELQNYGRFRMMVDINANIRFSIEFIENIDIEYRPQCTIKSEQLQQYNKYFDLVKRLYITPMLGKYAPSFIQSLKVKYTNYRQIGPINFTQFFFQADNLLMYISVMCGPDVTTNFCDLFEFQVYYHGVTLYAQQFKRILNQNVTNITGMSEWKAIEKEINKSYAYMLRGAKIVDIINKSANNYTFFTARYSSVAGTLDVEATFNSKNNSTIIHSITPAKNTSLTQMEGCKATKGPTYSKCLQCQKDYFLHQTEMCLHKIPNCKIQIGGVCLKCQTGYFRTEHGSVLVREPYSCD